MKTISRKKGFLLILCAAVLTYSLFQIFAVSGHLQYLIPAPAPAVSADPANPVRPNEAIDSLSKQLDEQAGEWADTMRRWSLDGAVEQAAFSADANACGGRLVLFGRYGQELHPLALRYGRPIFPEELDSGARVVLLDEQLALALFRVADPIGREVRIGGEGYRVVGIARHTRRVGDTAEGGAYIPLQSVIDLPLTLDVLQVEADPLTGVGAAVSFRTVCDGWQSGGTLIDLGKERMGAWLWLRVLGFVCGTILVLRAVRMLNRSVRGFVRLVRRRLERAYALRLTPWLVWRVLLFVLAYGLCLGVGALLMNFILQPVYTFPEWIPTVLVEWTDIHDTFWKVWGSYSVMRELRTPELARLRFFMLLVNGFSALAGVTLGMVYARWQGAYERIAASLPALRRCGAAVSAVRTTRPLLYEDLGYVPLTGVWPGAREAVPMLRIIDAQRVLAQLPPSGKDGTFVLDVTDAQIPDNALRLCITCADGRTAITPTRRDWDLQMSVDTLTSLIYGTTPFQAFTESRTGFDLRMRSPAMDGLFGHHLTVEGTAE